MPVLADILVFLAFVDILQDYGLLIRSVPGTARAQFLEFFRPNLGTLLATIPPSVANAAATRRFRHRRCHVKDALRLSGPVFETDEAERFSSVCNANNLVDQPVSFQSSFIIEISKFPLGNFREKFRIFKNSSPRKKVEFLKRMILEEISFLQKRIILPIESNQSYRI